MCIRVRSGIVPSLVLSLNPSIQFLVFDQLKLWWLRRKKLGGRNDEKDARTQSLTATESLVIGGMYASDAISFPLQSFKSSRVRNVNS